MRWGLGAEDVSNPSDSGLIFFFPLTLTVARPAFSKG